MKDDRQAEKGTSGRRVGARPTIRLILDLLAHEYQLRVRGGVADLVEERDANLICFAAGCCSFRLSSALNVT